MATYTETFPVSGGGATIGDQATLDLTWADVETAYFETYGSSPVLASISGAGRGATGYCRAEHDTDTADQFGEVEVYEVGTSSATQIGLCLRYAAGENTNIFAAVSNGSIQVRWTDDGGRSDIGAGVAVDTTGLPKTLRCEAEGTDFRVYWDGVLVATRTSPLTTGTRAGLYGHESTTGQSTAVTGPFVYGDLGDVGSEDKATTGTLTLALTGAGVASKAAGSTGALSLAVAGATSSAKAGTTTGPLGLALAGSGVTLKAAAASGALSLTVGSSGAVSTTEARSTAGALSVALGTSGTASKGTSTTGALALTLAGAGTVEADGGMAPHDGITDGALSLTLTTSGTVVKTATATGALGLTLAPAATTTKAADVGGMLELALTTSASVTIPGEYRDITVTIGAPTARALATSGPVPAHADTETGPTPARILTLSGPRRTRP